MTQEEIFEYNKRCAEFLGFLDFEELGDDKYKLGKTVYKITDPSIQPKEWMIDLACNPKNTGHFKFYSDWNWIMGTIEVISKKFGEAPLFKEVYQKWLHENVDTMDFLIFRWSKEETIRAINQFLIWYYNENNLT